MIRLFKRAGVERIVMAGKVQQGEHPAQAVEGADTAAGLAHHSLCGTVAQRRDNRDDTVLLAVIDEFARDGLIFDSALNLCPELLVNTGSLTKRKPTARELADIEFGWDLAKKMGELDVGQSIAVKERAVLAVEAIEGTDRAIQRAGEFCKAGGFVVVKVAKPQQDMRFDVPTVGCSTIETIYKAGGRVLAIEADKTIVLDRELTIALADRYGIAMVALQKQAGVIAA